MYFQRYSAPDESTLHADILAATDALAVARRNGDMAQALALSATLGGMLTTARRESDACKLLEEALAEARDCGQEAMQGWLQHMLATARQYCGDRIDAHAGFAEALSIARRLGLEELEHYALHHWGRCLVEDGQVDRARECFLAALAIRERLGDPRQASSRRALAALDAGEHGVVADGLAAPGGKHAGGATT